MSDIQGGFLTPYVCSSPIKGQISRISSQVVNLIGFYPFKTAADALSNINSVSEGIVSDDLKLFLETNMPKGKAVLGVSDSKLSSSISDACGIKCSHIGVVPEVYPLIILIPASND